jgi:hypothetical protein
VYLDSWLNACVAIERAVNVAQGVNFKKEKSKRIARWIIIILPFCIMGTIIHEPLYRELFVYNPQKLNKDANKIAEIEISRNETENFVWCMTHYSRTIQDYNTAILFFHLVAPFVVNLFSALFIIFFGARKRSATPTEQSYTEHVLEPLSDHRPLIISPIILLVLSFPRLIISMLSGCVKTSHNPWLYLLGYFMSFTSSMLIFVVFVLPSKLYRQTFIKSLTSWRRRTRQ